VEDRAIRGRWEGDLLSGAKNSCIATLVERHSHFAMLIIAMLIKGSSKDTDVVVATLSRLTDVGSRTGDGLAQGSRGSHGRHRLLLRSTESLAARQQRKHPSVATAILPPRTEPCVLRRCSDEDILGHSDGVGGICGIQ
jgi:hypothetical protein